MASAQVAHVSCRVSRATRRHHRPPLAACPLAAKLIGNHPPAFSTCPIPVASPVTDRSGPTSRAIFQELPKRFNVEWSYWSPRLAGPTARPSLDETVLLHFVGEKPWRRRRKGKPGDFDPRWWATFARGRMVVIGAEKNASTVSGGLAAYGAVGDSGADEAVARGARALVERGLREPAVSLPHPSRSSHPGPALSAKPAPTTHTRWRVSPEGALVDERDALIQEEGWLLAQFEHIVVVAGASGESGGKAAAQRGGGTARGGARALRGADALAGERLGGSGRGRRGEPSAALLGPGSVVHAACELRSAFDAHDLLACFTSSRPRGVFSVGLSPHQREVTSKAWALHVSQVCTAQSPCAAGGGGRPFLDLKVRDLEPMRILPPRIKAPR